MPKRLPGVLGSLRDIFQESPRTRIFVTGRPHVEVGIAGCFAAAIIVPICPSTQEIKRYFREEVENGQHV